MSEINTDQEVSDKSIAIFHFYMQKPSSLKNGKEKKLLKIKKIMRKCTKKTSGKKKIDFRYVFCAADINMTVLYCIL